MKYTLTKDATLFFINEDQIEEFSGIFNTFCTSINFEKGLYVEEDIVHNSFNLWLMMQPVSKEIMESMEKTMYYTGDFLIFDAMRKNKIFKQLKSSVANDAIRQCQVASCLSNQLNIWLLEKIGNLEKTPLFNHSHNQYFLLYKEENLWNNRDFLDVVAAYTKQITNALSDQLRFGQIFTRALYQLEQLTVYEAEVKRA